MPNGGDRRKREKGRRKAKAARRNKYNDGKGPLGIVGPRLGTIFIIPSISIEL